jgi:beta-lactamase regulating signal transducer with metallopeptidase domain
MLQYLINCSAIWLLSLLCYDLFLRRNTFHNYNRIYLLGTLIGGMLIPFLSLENEKRLYQETTPNNGLERTIEIKKYLVTAAQIKPTQSLDWIFWLKIIYITGVVLSLCVLLADLLKTIRLYKEGNKTNIDGLHIIETQQVHSPFSLFGLIFLSAQQPYDEEQLSMILMHEKRHNHLLHSIDLLVVQLVKIIFWFHPLPYIYRLRLLMVHEYQADVVVAAPLADYGAFLVEQSFLQNTPSIAHSFHRSPIKNRIIMLTRKSSTWSKSKMLLAIPVMVISVSCFSKDVSDNKRVQNGNKVTFKGNVFELTTPPPDTVTIQDPTTGKWDTAMMQVDPFPTIMNHEKILTDKDVDEAPLSKNSIEYYVKSLFKGNKTLFNRLEDGEYYIYLNQFVVGSNGKVVYYKFDGIENRKYERLPGSGKQTSVPVKPQEVKNSIDQLINDLASGLVFDPAIKNGKDVVCTSDFGDKGFLIKVENHIATLK